MDFKGFIRGFIEGKQVLVVLFFGLIGVFAPIGSIYVSALRGQQFFAQFNSTLLMLLTLLVIVFFIIKSFDFLFNKNSKLFLLSLGLLIIILLSFFYNLLIFISL